MEIQGPGFLIFFPSETYYPPVGPGDRKEEFKNDDDEIIELAILIMVSLWSK